MSNETLFISVCLTHVNVWESIEKPCSCVQFIKSHIFLLQVMRESVSGTTSHMHCVWTCNEIEGSYDKVSYHHSSKLYRKKNITHLLPLVLLQVLRITDGNKPMIFSGIAYADTYILACVYTFTMMYFNIDTLVLRAVPCLYLSIDTQAENCM